MLGLSATQTVMMVSLVTVVYSSVGGLRGVILTDVFQFVLSMIGMVVAAVFIIQMPEVGGLDGLFQNANVVDKLDFIPKIDNFELFATLFMIPLAVQWWSTWYPGAEPGGGGYVAQRMLSAKDESSAVKATLLFNIAHYALRPWPWILIALASLVVYPDIASISEAFPNIEASKLDDDLAFPAMLTLLPSGLVGLLLAALIAALMSTISTHLNWGSSYVVNDFYARFVNQEASEKTKVRIGQLSTVVLMVLAAIFSLYLQGAKEAFDILLQIGAGTGLLFILRWFWWRINAYSEIIAMIVSFAIAVFFEVVETGFAGHEKMIIGVVITTIAWLLATYLAPGTDMERLKSFYSRIRPQGSGWNHVTTNMTQTEIAAVEQTTDPGLTNQILMMLMGCVFVYAALFGVGYLLMGAMTSGFIGLAISAVVGVVLYKQAFGNK